MFSLPNLVLMSACQRERRPCYILEKGKCGHNYNMFNRQNEIALGDIIPYCVQNMIVGS